MQGAENTSAPICSPRACVGRGQGGDWNTVAAFEAVEPESCAALGYTLPATPAAEPVRRVYLPDLNDPARRDEPSRP